jgi:teichuronic acid biosynthesis glycosyltransferase TuaC
MHVLFFVSNYSSLIFPNKGYFFKVICEGLASKGIQVTVIAPLPYSNKWIEKLIPRLKNYHLIPRKEKRNGITIYRPRYISFPFVDKFRLRPFLIFNSLKPLLSKLNPQLIDFRNSYPSYPLGDVAEKLAKYYQVPYLYTINGQEYPMCEPDTDLMTSRLKRYAKGAAKMLGVSNEIVREIKRTTEVNAELTVHPVGVHVSRITAEEKSLLKQRLQLNSGKIYFLYAGAISFLKGTDVLLTAFRKLNLADTILILIGPMDKDAFQFNNNEYYLGLQPPEIVYQYMQVCNLFIFPSRIEGMPNVLKEAGAVGIPIIASRVGGIPELLGEDERGLLMPDISVESLLSSIEKAINHSNEMTTRCIKMKEYIEAEYSVEACTKKLIEQYQQVLKK